MGALDGKVACITGGTRGISRATAEAFVGEGAKVVSDGRIIEMFSAESALKGQNTVEEVAAVAVFPASDAAGNNPGNLFPVDGGPMAY